MKHFLFVRKTLLLSSVFSCLIICSSLSSCERGTDLPEPLPEQPQPCSNCLPDITTTGKGTFGCKVNGTIWLPKGGGGWNPATTLSYFKEELSFGGYNSSLKESIGLYVSAITDTGFYDFSGTVFNTSGAGLTPEDGANRYFISPITNGYLRLSRFDMNNGIVSGTFAFDAYNTQGDTVHITDGRFDLHF